ncbi:uncharacterized protein LOC112563632 isoform X2 [Pomacea canaliculata]|uniref:uncharacterized protein LOC112563632 isoform X2 n=1 Tax=Pomacea canaliculata TaxID=400727 RepID=UPI000D73892C|nr:uncharacterized protein LOC112563632 isoform X2 [Pomacea canaliculata]
MNADFDLTPALALRKLAVLFESGKSEECAILLRRLADVSLDAILELLPVEVLHDGIPASLPVLEAIYLKAFQDGCGRLPADKLRAEQLLQHLVALFARQSSSAGLGTSGPKNCNLHMPCCRSILRVLMAQDPSFRHNIAQRKRGVEQCLRRMGQHGLVSSAAGHLTTLHDALRAEFERKAGQFKTAMTVFDQLHLGSGRHNRPERQGPGNGGTNGGGGGVVAAAPTEAGHQRLLQVTRGEVQERLIKNKSLLTAAEPAEERAHLTRLLRTLRTRIEYDKALLFHDTELRRIGMTTSTRSRLPAALASPPSSPAISVSNSKANHLSPNHHSPNHHHHQQQPVAETLLGFRMGYSAILRVAREVDGRTSAEEDDENVEDSSASENEDQEEGEWESGFRPPPPASSLSGRQRATVVSLNSSRSRHLNISLPSSAGRHRSRQLTGSRGRNKDAGMQATPVMEAEGEVSGEDKQTKSMMASEPCLATAAGNVASTSVLQQEISYLQQELSVARDRIQCLQAQEKQLRECLSNHAHQQFQMGNQQFEDLTLGSQRPTALIRRFGDLYLDGRVDALDSLDQMTLLKDLDALKIKILFSIVVLAFKAAQQNLNELRGQLCHLLHLPLSPAANQHQDLQQFPQQNIISSSHTSYLTAEMEMHITKYLCKTADTFDISELVFDVSQQIYNTLYDYPCLRACPGLLDYISQCVRLAWGLSVQRKPYTINYDAHKFDSSMYTRFHTSDPNSEEIKTFLWPSLIDSLGRCASKGVVIT